MKTSICYGNMNMTHELLAYRPLPFNRSSIIEMPPLATCPCSVLNVDWFTPLFEGYDMKKVANN